MNNFKLNRVSKGEGKCEVLKNTVVNIHKNASISIESGVFTLNSKWDQNEPFYTLFSLRKGSSLVVKKSFKIYSNSRIYVNNKATLTLGSGYINNNLSLSCFDSITIGNDVAISENVTIRDSDNHQINSHEHIVSAPIQIGNKVWIGMNVTILKGVKIGSGSIIGAGSIVTQDIPENTLAIGVPARVVKRNVEWS